MGTQCDRQIVVVGGGIAGQAVCETVRERDPDAAIALLCGEPHLPYDRVRLSELLLSDARAAELALRPPEWFADNRIEVRTSCRVSALDPEQHVLTLPGGETLCYGALALATGSQPLLPSLPGLELPGVHPFRSPKDCGAIRASTAARSGRAAVIGGGLLGLEAARGIAAHGWPVTVVHLVDRLMERQLDSGAAALLIPALEQLGVQVLLDRQTERILGSERVTGLRFAGGDELAADMVVVSIGIRPEVSLARGAGLEVDRAIVVDDALRTSADAVVAVGECAQHRGTVYGLVAPILEQVRVAADTLLEHAGRGRAGRTYRGSILSARLKVAGIELVAMGSADGEVEAVCSDARAGVYRKLVVQGGRAAGAILLGDTRGSEALLADVCGGAPVDDPLARLVQAAEATPAELSDGAQVCNCNGVCKGEIVGAVREGGCATPREVMARTRAGTGCGSCKPLVVELVASAAGGLSDEPAYLCPCRGQTREQLAAAIRENGWQAVSEVSAGCGSGRECGACKPALAYLVSEVNANRHREERHARFINDRVHANIQNDGSFSVVPRMRGGVVTPQQLRRIADAAEKYEVPLVKVTGGQRIDLLGVRKQDLPDVWRDLDMPSGHAYAKAVRTVKTCVGSDFCRFGVGDSIGLGIEMESAWEGLYTPAKVKSGVSGCPRNCAEATVKDIGVVAVEGGWQVRVGGAAGAVVREADVLCTVQTRREALRVSTAFLQYYREHADYKERTYDFVPRVGLEKIREQVLDEAHSSELVERLRIARAAAGDPWLERDAPYHPRQFADLDGGLHEAAHTVEAGDDDRGSRSSGGSPVGDSARVGVAS